ncbi:MAG: amidase [Nitriliruptoraceae bacterium]
MAEARDYTVATIAAKIADGSLTASALLESCLERIDAREADVGAFAHLDREQARATAKQRDQEAPRTPLHGVPVGVKDIYDTASMPTSYGTVIYAGHQPNRDAFVVSALAKAGAVLVGKTVATEFGILTPGKTRNPHDLERTPGGSSSGSAAAVADAMLPISVGSQTTGSTIRPAAFCGVYGMKPSAGLIDRTGMLLHSQTLDAVGFFGREADDLTVLFDVLARPHPTHTGRREESDLWRDTSTNPRFAFVRTSIFEDLEPGIGDALLRGVDRLSDAGAEVIERELPVSLEEIIAVQTVIADYEAAECLGGEYDNHQSQLSDFLVTMIERGRSVSREAFEEALAICRHTFWTFAALYDGIDAVLTPAAPGEAPLGIRATGSPAYGRLWTFAGVPAISVPGLTGPSGMPVGMQLTARNGDDYRAIAASRWVGEHLT